MDCGRGNDRNFPFQLPEPAAWACTCGIYAYKQPYRMRMKNDIFYRPREQP
jgi:hypothetical protein